MGFLDRFFGPPGKNAFAKQVMEAIRKAGATDTLNYDAEQFRIVSDQGSVSFLQNAYDEFRAASRRDRNEIVRRHVRAWFAPRREMPSEFEDAQPDIMPVVRARAYFDLTALRFEAEGTPYREAPYQPLGDHLAVGLVYDMPEFMRSISQEDLDTWGVSFYEAMEVARENLAKLPMALIGPREGPGVYLSGSGDNYDASRMLRLDVIRNLNCLGDCIAMVPNRDNLIIGGADDDDGLRGMLELAKKTLDEPRPITGLAFRLDGDDWVPWLPPDDHPLHGDFQVLHVQWLARDYHEQKQLLDQLHQRQGEDIFVASYSAIENNETGELRSYCVWGENVRALLPRTDLIALAGKNDEHVLVTWETVQSVCGGLLEATDLYPERYRVSEFPTREQLKALDDMAA